MSYVEVDVRLLRRWWAQPDHFERMTAYFAHHDLLRFTQVMMASITATLGVATALMLFSPSGPHGWPAVAASVAVTAACAVMAGCWVLFWPSRRQSIAFAIFANGCIAVALLIQSNPVAALIGSSAAFAVLCGYVGFFHSPRLMVLSYVVAQSATVVIAAQVVHGGDPFLAVVACLLVNIALLSIPFSIQAVSYVMGADALRSHRDQLTGLLNRRAFYHGAQRLLHNHDPGCGCHLTVVMVDLDDFKTLNDTRGHVEGDKALIAVGRALRSAARSAAVIARAGGEEFLVADILPAEDIELIAARITNAVAASPFQITASVGITSVSVHEQHSTSQQHLLEKLVMAADSAMYTAKRAGGNQFRRHAVEVRIKQVWAGSHRA